MTIGALRLCAGFATFLLLFTFRRGDAAWIWYGLALLASQLGNSAGVYLAPRLRRRAREEWMVTGAAALMGAVCLTAGTVQVGRHWLVAVMLAGGIGLAAGAGKTAFDSMVQRDVPGHARSRCFARFESVFQLAWAIGGEAAVVLSPALTTGFAAMGLIGLAGAGTFGVGSRRARRGALPAWFPGAVPRPGAHDGPRRAGGPGRQPASPSQASTGGTVAAERREGRAGDDWTAGTTGGGWHWPDR